MKRSLLVLFLLIAAATAPAQRNDRAVEQMMTQRSLDCYDIYYNAILLIPRLYKEGKMDSIDAVIDYTHRNCELYEATVSYQLLHSIQTNNFSEVIFPVRYDTTGRVRMYEPYKELPAGVYRNNIIGFLNRHIENTKTYRHNEHIPNYLASARKDYYEFLRSIASSLAGKPSLKPVEQFIVAVYTQPDSVKFEKLKDTVYDRTLLQKAYQRGTRDGGACYGLTLGEWTPSGNLSILGIHPYFGGFLGAQEQGFSGYVTFNVAFSDKSSKTYVVKKDDRLYATDHFAQYYIGYDLSQALYSTRQTEFTLGGGLGYDGITVLADSPGVHSSRTLSSFNWHLGGGFKVFLKHTTDRNSFHHSYLGIQANYNFVYYNNTDATSLSGRYMTIGLVYGGFSASLPTRSERIWRNHRWEM